MNFEATSIFDFLNGHFDQPTHFIASMITLFHKFFCEKYESLLEISPEESAKTENLTNISAEPMKELKFFIMIVLQSMIYYYGGLLEKKMQENPNEMYDFILEKVISKEIHNILVHSYNISNSTDYIRYKQIIESLFDISCSDLQIDSYFCLDNKNDHNGYDFPISQLKQIQEMFTPMKKLEIISETTDNICASVDEY